MFEPRQVADSRLAQVKKNDDIANTYLMWFVYVKGRAKDAPIGARVDSPYLRLRCRRRTGRVRTHARGAARPSGLGEPTRYDDC